jgi:hypothetical protein
MPHDFLAHLGGHLDEGAELGELPALLGRQSRTSELFTGVGDEHLPLTREVLDDGVVLVCCYVPGGEDGVLLPHHGEDLYHLWHDLAAHVGYGDAFTVVRLALQRVLAEVLPAVDRGQPHDLGAER